MALTKTALRLNDKKRIESLSDEELTPNTQLVLTSTSTDSRPWRLVSVHCRYSGSVTTTVTITVDSSLGAAYDHDIGSIALSAEPDGDFEPANERIFMPGDQVVVTAPAVAAVTSAIEVIRELL